MGSPMSVPQVARGRSLRSVVGEGGTLGGLSRGEVRHAIPVQILSGLEWRQRDHVEWWCSFEYTRAGLSFRRQTQVRVGPRVVLEYTRRLDSGRLLRRRPGGAP